MRPKLGLSSFPFAPVSDEGLFRCCASYAYDFKGYRLLSQEKNTAIKSIDEESIFKDKTYMPADIGKNLRIFRNSRGLSLDGLAELSGINRDHIGRIERGERKNPEHETQAALAEALGITIAQLIGEVEGALPRHPLKVIVRSDEGLHLTDEEKKLLKEWRDLDERGRVNVMGAIKNEKRWNEDHHEPKKKHLK